MAKRLIDEGYEVTFVCPPGMYTDEFGEQGIGWIPWQVSRRGLNPIEEGRSVLELAQIYRQVRPILVHHSTIKPNLYGTLAVMLNHLNGPQSTRPAVLNSFMGIGFVFSDHAMARLLRLAVVPLLRLALRRESVYTTFSNEEDRSTLTNAGIVTASNSSVLISEFVDTDVFSPSESADHVSPVCVFMGARLLWDKGVQEFVDTAQAVQAQTDVPVDFWLAGEPDTGAPNHVPHDMLRAWDDEGVIRWLGHRSDMPALFRKVDIGFLPTHYNEGTPRFLVEGASSGLPLVTTDIEACRRVVRHQSNGFVVPIKDVKAFSDAITKLVQNPELRQSCGRESRRLAEEMYEKDKNLDEWMKLYGRLIQRRS